MPIHTKLFRLHEAINKHAIVTPCPNHPHIGRCSCGLYLYGMRGRLELLSGALELWLSSPIAPDPKDINQYISFLHKRRLPITVGMSQAKKGPHPYRWIAECLVEHSLQPHKRIWT